MLELGPEGPETPEARQEAGGGEWRAVAAIVAASIGLLAWFSLEVL